MRETNQQHDRRGTDVDARAVQSDDAKDRDMGTALRTVYQQTVEEQIPDDLLDLLGKLS